MCYTHVFPYMYDPYTHVHVHRERESSIHSETSGVKSASNPTKPLRRRGRAQEGSSDLVAGKVFTVCIDCTPLYMYTNLVCIESETSGVKSASTKPLRRHGRAQGGSSGLVAGILFVDCGPLYMHSNLACIESATSGTKRVKNTKRYPGESIYLTGVFNVTYLHSIGSYCQ